jgi:membrane-associated HD superfamily phosphohydrolase
MAEQFIKFFNNTEPIDFNDIDKDGNVKIKPVYINKKKIRSEKQILQTLIMREHLKIKHDAINEEKAKMKQELQNKFIHLKTKKEAEKKLKIIINDMFKDNTTYDELEELKTYEQMMNKLIKQNEYLLNENKKLMSENLELYNEIEIIKDKKNNNKILYVN